jgi:LysR family glycine cleavage system transcriptional activator
MRRLPNLNALRAFDAAARQGSFVGAAEELGVSHAAVSRHVRNLEAELGTALFERHARHVVLTGEGALFAKTVSESLSSLEIGAGRLRRGFVRSTVVLDIESDLAVSWLMPHLTEDVLDALNVHLDVRVRPDPPRLVLGDADLAVSWGAVQCTGFKTERFLDPIVFPVASPALFGAGTKLEDPGIFTNNRLIHERGLYWWRRSFETLGLSLDDAAGHLFFNRSHLCIEAAVRGLGIAMGDDATCAAHLATGALVRLPRPEMPSRDRYYLLVPDRTQLSRPVRHVRDWLIEVAHQKRYPRNSAAIKQP